MRIRIFNAAVLTDDLNRRLFSDARHTRHIIRGITHQRFYIYKLLWRDTVLFHHLLRIVIFYLCSCLFRLWNPYLDLLRRKLQQIPVAGYDGNEHSLRFTALCNRT